MGSPRKKTKIKSALLKKGFSSDEGGNHTKLIFSHEDQKEAIFTILSRGIKEYGSSLLGKMSRQLKVTNSELLDLIDCDIDQEDYIKILRNRDVLKPLPPPPDEDLPF